MAFKETDMVRANDSISFSMITSVCFRVLIIADENTFKGSFENFSVFLNRLDQDKSATSDFSHV